MVRYKRYRRRYKNTTNLIKMKFQSFMDIHTEKDKMQIISVSAGGKNILQRLPAQFGAYKYYKIGNISVKLVPASTLPVDPTGLSYEEGEQTVDPRDQLTPGMMRITNGEDVFEQITGMSADAQHALYNSMMLDPRWFKWMLQSGVKRHATPRYWQIGQLHQDKWPGSSINEPHYTQLGGDSPAFVGTTNAQFIDTAGSVTPATGIGNAAIYYDRPNSDPRALFQVGHRGVLGWLPTDGMEPMLNTPLIACPPEIEVMKIILPPAYKTEYYYRMYISETVYFREPIMQAIGVSDFPYRPLDIFHYQQGPVPDTPNNNRVYDYFPDAKTGGNYGDD